MMKGESVHASRSHIPDAFRVKWTAGAAKDLDDIIGYISHDNTDSALAVLSEIQDKARSLSSLPFRGTILPELEQHGLRLYRQLSIGPWRLIYRVQGNEVLVLAVLDGRRNLQQILQDLLLR